MTPQFTKNLFMLQWELNAYLEAGSDQVRKRDIRSWVDPDTDSFYDVLREWESKGFIRILANPRMSKEKDVCLRILRCIDAIPEPPDLADEE